MRVRNIALVLLVFSVLIVASCQKQSVGSKLDNPEEGYTGARVTPTTTPVAYGGGGSGRGAGTRPASTVGLTVTRPVSGESWNLNSGIKSINVKTNSDSKCKYKLGTSSSVFNTAVSKMKWFENYAAAKKTHSVVVVPNVAGQSGAYDKFYKGNNYLVINCASSSGDTETKTIQFKGV